MRKKFLLICISVFLLISILSVESVYADVPSVLTVDISKDGSDSILNINVRHNNPTSIHYIDIIEVEINGELEQVSGLEPQTETSFTQQHNVGDKVIESLRVRAHCTSHGWSVWKVVDTDGSDGNGGQGIPGFPSESIIIGIVFAFAVIIFIRRKNTLSLPLL